MGGGVGGLVGVGVVCRNRSKSFNALYLVCN